jgi:endogenous inhibitor of DNA gyrase (YacG/DUF329 family)
MPLVLSNPGSGMPLELSICPVCGVSVSQPAIGRPRLYCSPECRVVEANRLRRFRTPIPAWRIAQYERIANRIEQENNPMKESTL